MMSRHFFYKIFCMLRSPFYKSKIRKITMAQSTKQIWITALLCSFTMALIMSGIISATKLGFTYEWLTSWPISFLFAWPCALLLNLTLLPKIRSWVVNNF
ncbi:DUF2798 domain-containing protein [Vibrio rotiferianus]